jgi:hypothetical protein
MNANERAIEPGGAARGDTMIVTGVGAASTRDAPTSSNDQMKRRIRLRLELDTRAYRIRSIVFSISAFVSSQD